MHYFQFNIGDYARDTAHLTEMEDLAYRRMLDLYYRAEGPLPSSIDEIARLIRMRSHTASIAIVLQDFFAECADGYRNQRADQELRSIYEKSAKAKASANARWSKNKDLQKPDAMRTHSEGNADDMLPITHYPLPITQDTEVKDPMSKPAVIDDRVKQVIDLLNSMTGSKYKASTKSHAGNISGRLNDGHSVDDLMAVVRFKVGDWLHDPKMAQYLRPETLFQAGKFNGYLTAAKATQGPLAGLSAISRKNAQNLAGWLNEE